MYYLPTQWLGHREDAVSEYPRLAIGGLESDSIYDGERAWDAQEYGKVADALVWNIDRVVPHYLPDQVP